MHRIRLSLSVVSALLLATTVAGCGGSEDTSGGSSGGASSGEALGAAAELVPEDLKGESLSAVVMNDYPPAGYVEGGELVGTAPDLLRAIADDAGLDLEIQGSSWDAMIPGLQAKRWDVMHAAAIITPERVAMFDFVSVEKNYTAFVSDTASGVTIEDAADVCGLTVSVVKASIDGEAVNKINDEVCEPEGAEPATLSTFAGNDAALLAVSSGRADAVVMGGGVIPDLLKKTGDKFEEQPLEFEPTFGGIAFTKGSELGPIFLQAVKDLMESGTYQEIYDSYNVGNSVIDNPELITE